MTEPWLQVLHAGEYGVLCQPGPSWKWSGFENQNNDSLGHTVVPSKYELADWARNRNDWTPWQSHVVQWPNGERLFYKAGTLGYVSGRPTALYDLAHATSTEELQYGIDDAFDGQDDYSKAVKELDMNIRRSSINHDEVNKRFFDLVCKCFKSEVQALLQHLGEEADVRIELMLRKELDIYNKSFCITWSSEKDYPGKPMQPPKTAAEKQYRRRLQRRLRKRYTKM